METTAISSQIGTLDKKITSDDTDTIVWTHKLNLPTIAPAEVEWGVLDIYIANEWNTDGTPKKDKGQLVAKYPLVLYRNTYAFQEINNWNGTSTVTNDSYIITPMVAAGKKNNNNQFTGVMMGTYSPQFPSTGLYGFKDGVATFGFKEDGSCFLGANEETGRIEFNTGDTGGNLLINAQIKRNATFDFGRKYKYKEGTTGLQFLEKKLSFGDYFNDTLFSGMIIETIGYQNPDIAQDTKEGNGESRTYIGNIMGYCKKTDDLLADDEGDNIVRDLGFLIRHEGNYGGKSNAFAINSNSDIYITSQSGVANSCPSANLTFDPKTCIALTNNIELITQDFLQLKFNNGKIIYFKSDGIYIGSIEPGKLPLYEW